MWSLVPRCRPHFGHAVSTDKKAVTWPLQDAPLDFTQQLLALSEREAELADRAGPELLNRVVDRPAAHVDAAVGQDACDTLGCGAELQVVADRQQDDVTRKPMT